MISGGQIEYVNQSFLLNFREQIQECEKDRDAIIQIKEESFFSKVKSLFFGRHKNETLPTKQGAKFLTKGLLKNHQFGNQGDENTYYLNIEQIIKMPQSELEKKRFCCKMQSTSLD